MPLVCLVWRLNNTTRSILFHFLFIFYIFVFKEPSQSDFVLLCSVQGTVPYSIAVFSKEIEKK